METPNLSTDPTPVRDLTPTVPAPADTKVTRLRQNQGWTCELCQLRFRRPSAKHLSRHGYTWAHYSRVFGGAATSTPYPPAGAVVLTAPSTSATAAAIALAADPRFVAEVGDAMLNGPLRDRLSYSVARLLETRARAHGDAVDRLSRINSELGADWRIKQGGEAGAATETKDLIAMHSAALNEVRSSEELFTKVMKLAIEESKGRKEQLGVPEGLDKFTGAAETLPVPANLTPSDREAVRSLMAKMTAAVVARRAKSTTVVDALPLPSSTVQVTGTPERVLPAGIDPTPVKGADEPF